MQRYGVGFHPDNAQIHCLAHVVNLVVQKILGAALEADDPDVQDYYALLNKQFPVHFDLEEADVELHEFEAHEYGDGRDDDSNAADGSSNSEKDDIVDPDSGEKETFTGMTTIQKVCQ